MTRQICAAIALVIASTTIAAAQPRVVVECDRRQGCFVDAAALERADVIELDVSAVVEMAPRPAVKMGKKPPKRKVAVVEDGAALIAKKCAAIGLHCVVTRAGAEGWLVLVDGQQFFVRVADLQKPPDDSGLSSKCTGGCAEVDDPVVWEGVTVSDSVQAPGAAKPVTGGGQIGVTVIGGDETAAPSLERPDDRAFADVVLVGDAHGYRCSGVLIAPRVVLTAAHCLPATRVAFAARVNAIVRSQAVVAAVAHPDGLDVAALTLDAPAAFPARPRRGGGDTAPPRGAVQLVGFGADDPRGNGGFGVKRRGGVLVGGWGCEGRRPQALGCDPAHEMVIPPDSARDTCAGDSGGPVLERSGRSWRLLGITSRPARGRENCGGGGIYVRADAVASWLDPLLEDLR